MSNTDPLHSPRTQTEALRDMFLVALRSASHEELIAVQAKIGAWALEKLLDTAMGEAPEQAPPPPETKQRGAMCTDALRIQDALSNFKAKIEAEGRMFNQREISRAIGIKRVSQQIVSGTAKRLSLETLKLIEEFLK